jgi:methylmalonyl-CoA/ethylmalonyl-CoA epimerase
MISLLHSVVFHHIGVACHSLDDERVFWTAFGYAQEGNGFVDPIQGVRGIFLVGGGPRLELIEALPESTTIAPFLKRGIRFYHMGYYTEDLAGAISYAIGIGGLQTTEPAAASAFHGRKIAFVMMPNGQLIELIEAPSPDHTR